MQWSNSSNQNITTGQMLNAYTHLNPISHSDSDQFFQDFGPGNVTSSVNPFVHFIDKPYERLLVYEHIMHELQNTDLAKYERMHKGTPFFFLSWLAFTVKDFEKAIYYMDQAISEDIRATTTTTNPLGWQSTPAANFLLLDPNQPTAVARSIMQMLAVEFQQQLSRFNTSSGAGMTLLQYRNRFVTPNMTNNSFRSIISGFYVFTMEYVERTKMIQLKSNHGGSIEPFLIHLFKGCLIFESLLKTKYGSSTVNTLGGYLSQQDAMTDLEISQGNYNGQALWRQGSRALQDVVGDLPNWRSEDHKERIIAITYGIRNTAGHDLSWPVSFDEITYQEIYNAIVDSIFWFIYKVMI